MSNDRPFVVALTGGIASGKTAAANEFAALGIPVIDTDQLARDVVEPGTPGLKAIIDAFGNEVLDAEGRLDRRRMRERVFANPDERRKLEAITHPAIRQELARRSASATGPYQMHVIPLLVESGRARTHNRLLVVDCPEEIQLQRLMQRDGSTLAQAQQILAAQARRSERLAVADDVIQNTGSLDALRAEVAALHARYLELAK